MLFGGGWVAGDVVFVLGVTGVGDGHGAVDGFVFTAPLFVASLVGELAAAVAEPGTLPDGLVAAGVIAVVEVVELWIAGHGALRFRFLMFAVEVAEAGGFAPGFVADVAEAGVDPTLLLVPGFGCVAGVAELGVVPAVGVIP